MEGAKIHTQLFFFESFTYDKAALRTYIRRNVLFSIFLTKSIFIQSMSNETK